MKDRFMNGVVAGILAGVVSALTDYLVVNGLRIGSVRFVDFAGVFIYGERPHGLHEVIFAQIGALLFHGLLGAIFSYLLVHITSKYYLIKSILYGLLIWFAIYAIVTLFRVPFLVNTPFNAAVKDTVIAGLFGLVLGIVYRWLKNRDKIETDFE